MKVYNFTVVLILATISTLHCIPIEVVYTGDSCDCPKALNYIVNVPPPPETKEYIRGEHGYKLDVPVQGKAKVTYSFDFTVQQPKPPAPVEDEKWNLYAKVDRITAHNKDCLAPNQESSSTCTCNRCVDSRNTRYRYVSPAFQRVIIRRRSPQKSTHPNSLCKRVKRRPLAWAAIIKPVNERAFSAAAPMLKSRHKRGLSRLFNLNRRTENLRRPERLVKHYHKRLQPPTTTTARPKVVQHFKSLPNLPNIVGGRLPFAHLRNLILPPRLRGKRDIKGEYDLIEKEREEMDLTLPEIIQFMPETLDPNFKRGQCQFACHSQQTQEELLHRVEPNSVTEETTHSTVNSLSTEGTTEQIDSQADNNDGDNAIDSSHTKRQVEHYGCGYTHSPLPPPPPNYSLETYAPSTDSPHGHDPAPQQYVGAPPVYANPEPVPAAHPRSMYEDAAYGGGPIYNPSSPGYYANYELDRIIADIVGRHSDFIEAGTHKGGALVDPSDVQKQHTKSFLRQLMGGRWQTWFGDEAPQQVVYAPPQAYQQYPSSSYSPPPPPYNDYRHTK